MDPRMTGYGRHVMAPAVVSWSTPTFNPNYYTAHRTQAYKKSWKDELDSVKEALDDQKKLRRDKNLLAQLHNLVDVLHARNKPPTPPPPPDRFTEILGAMMKQQQTLSELVRGVAEDRKEARQYMQGQFAQANPTQHRSARTPHVHPLEEQYRRTKESPSEYKQMLAELDFDDDEAENYIDAEKNFRFDPDLTSDQKAAIVKKVRANREALHHKEVRRLIRGKRRFRVIGWTVMFPTLVKNSIHKRKSVKREANIKQMEDSIQVYKEVAHTWVLKAVRMPLVSVLNDPNLDLNIIGGKPDSANFLKLQVRIKGIIQGFRESTSATEMPTPLRMFMSRYIANGAYLPKNSLLSFERSRLEWDQFGAICNQAREKQQMLACFFLVTKHLVDILVRPKESGLNIRAAKTATNMKIIASIMQLLVLTLFARTGRASQDIIADETDIMQRKKGQVLSLRNDDGVSQNLIAFSEFQGVSHLLLPFLEDMREEIRSWSEELLRVCSF